jgi:hypothetical protein
VEVYREQISVNIFIRQTSKLISSGSFLSFEKQLIAQGDGFQIVPIFLAISLYIIRFSDEPPEKSGQPLAGIFPFVKLLFSWVIFRIGGNSYSR